MLLQENIMLLQYTVISDICLIGICKQLHLMFLWVKYWLRHRYQHQWIFLPLFAYSSHNIYGIPICIKVIYSQDLHC